MEHPLRILVTRRLPPAVEAHLARRHQVCLNPADEPLDEERLRAAMRTHDVLLPTITDRIDANLLKEGGRVRLIANFGAGLDHVDLDAARAAGIMVTNTPDALTDATADIAILLMLMAARRAGEGERMLRAGRWTGWAPMNMIGQGLTGKTLGLVGFGRIARATARRARALGMTIAYVSRSPALAETEREVEAVRFPDLGALAEAADVLSLHVPGGPDTRHLVDRALLSRMKPHAIIVNTARGSVVDEAALASALREGTIAAAGLDVHECEPAIHPALLNLENAVLLPHIGSATLETRTAMGMQAAANIAAFASGQEPPNRVV